MKLVLEDGTTMVGQAFGAPRAVSGEVVFNTGMTGYIETLTDPSYRGQILTLTYPLVGNYGVPAPRPPGTLDGPYESDRIQVQGLVVQSYVDRYSHHAAVRSLGAWLAAEGIPAVTGIDTRTLTRKLREHGTMKGWLLPVEADTGRGAQGALGATRSPDVDTGRGAQGALGATRSPDVDIERVSKTAESVEMREEVFRLVAPREPIVYEGGHLKVLLIDAGAKDNIVRSLLERGVSVIRAPWHHARLDELAERADGVLIGNGPGDPKDLGPLIAAVRNLLGSYARPIFGICLGNQILALAAGGDTFKLPYGHRGVNQPVQDLLSRRCYITSQNHGYAVDDESLPPEWEPWFVNINDGTNEGIRSRLRPFFSVQFHPEATPGPKDAAYLFDDFLRLCGAMKGTANADPRPMMKGSAPGSTSTPRRQ